MDKNYFSLSPEVQVMHLQEAENQLNISSIAIEKDIWVCWLLKQLFELPIKMAFKGGTSLSRVFNLIERYSEDIDITGL
jgi:predicted nucleotidyltransferase component of viral defense system